ncbi:MAG TPA: hypothetical protein VGD58_12655 [Herpetosiphonaceae bacterium]
MNKLEYSPSTSDSFGLHGSVAADASSVHSRWEALFIVLLSVAAGLVLAIVWSFEVADGMLGATIANTTLGVDAKAVSIGGPLFGIIFGFAAGLAATFTACNCVVFSCVAPLVAEKQTQRQSIVRVLGWMVLGVLGVTMLYGAIGVFLRDSLPILSPARLAIGSGEGYPVRLAQSTVVFVILGAIFVVWGLHILQLVASPLHRFSSDHPWLKPLAIGLMVGFFTVGRPFPLFRKAFEYAVDTGNPVLSALVLALHGLGNIAVVVLLILLLVYGTGGRFQRWIRQHPHGVMILTAVSMLVGGTFFIAYWGVRVPSLFGIGWFPQMPYN